MSYSATRLIHRSEPDMHKDTPLILIATDNDGDLESITRLLGTMTSSPRVVRCHDGNEALDYLHRRGKFSFPGSTPRPGVIFLDLHPPDGKTVLANIRAHPELRLIPVIMLTPPADEAMCRKSLPTSPPGRIP
jgi:CheY-like chemotaxis protein